MTIQSLLSHWRSEATISENIVAWQSFPARSASFVPYSPGIHPAIVAALRLRGFSHLYAHQATAWEQVQARRNLVVVTGTASGKTLCYNLPVLDRMLSYPDARALYLFPTKALAQDQVEEIQDILSGISVEDYGQKDRISPSPGPYPLSPISPSVYDGDTPTRARPTIRANARLIITNPDMLHTGVLPHHTLWVDFLKNLQFVVIDEMHTYRGVFGSHVSNVIRRLKRVAAFYGAKPQFILTSATIANPVELAERLIEESVILIDEDASARGSRHFLIYNPPIVDRELGLRRSSMMESVRLVDDLLNYDLQTIVFGRARRTVELILMLLRQQSSSLIKNTLSDAKRKGGVQKNNQNNEIVRGYRSGYLPGQRREIERGLRQGKVRTVIATNALELGIDIGGIVASVLVGYPGTIASTWQQAGRAGRGNDTSLSILVTSASPLDQFLAHHPQYFFERSPEQALINPDNLLILLAHLRCATFELPFRKGENFGRVASETVEQILDHLSSEGLLHHSGEKYFWMADRYPSEGVSLRSASPERILLQLAQQNVWLTIGEVDLASAAWMVHPQAVYLHEAQTYLVDDLDLDHKVAHLHLAEVDYYTEPRTDTSVQLIELQDQSQTKGGIKQHGEILVTTQVTGFRKVKFLTHEQLGMGELTLPPAQLQTTAYWLTIGEETIDRLRAKGLWKNDPNQYGPTWAIQRDRARARDGYRCQVCGAAEQGRAHDVHHKIPFRTFSTTEEANQLNHLVTLCQACHHRVESAVRMRSGLAGLAFVLGNLAPLYLMCDMCDLGIHSDPQSILADGNPTVVLYDKVPDGIGFSERLYELHDELFTRADELVKACECADGCPSCVGPAGENGIGGKIETMALLTEMV